MNKSKQTMLKWLAVSVIALTASHQAWAGSPKTGVLKNVCRLTSDANVKYSNPQWSPDGSKIAFTHMSYDNLLVINADGTGKRQISDRSMVGYMYQWSADGDELLVRDTRYEHKSVGLPAVKTHAIWTISADGSQEQRVTADAVEMQPAAYRYSPLGRKSVAVNGKLAAVTGKSAKLATAAAKRVAQTSNVSFATDYEHLYVVAADGSRKSIYDGPAFCPALSPDGTKVAFCNQFDQIFIMNPDGTDRREVAKGFNPVWASDSQIVFHRCTDNGHDYLTGELVMTNILTGRELMLTTTPGRIEREPSISGDGSKIAFVDYVDGQVYVADFE